MSEREDARPVVIRADLVGQQLYQGQLHPELAAILRKLDARETGSSIDWQMIDKQFRSARGDLLRIEEAWRSAERQAELLNQSRIDARKGVVTRAGPFQSYHQWGLAVDLVWTREGYDDFTWKGKTHNFSRRETWLETGLPQWMESQGIEWGGRWSDPFDPAHFQLVKKVPVENTFALPGWWKLGGVDVAPISAKLKPADSAPSWLPVAVLAGAAGAVYVAFNRKR